MEESDMNISEWDIVGSSSLESKEDPKEDGSEEDGMVICSPEDVAEKDVPKGSSVEDVEQECQPIVSSCESSCSSSDIDIIDESALDESHANNISTPSIELSLSSSFETNLSASVSALYVSEPIQDSATNTIVQFDRPIRNPDSRNYYLIVLGIGCLLALFLHVPETPIDAIKEMEKRIIILQEENRELKTQVTSKVEDDKLFVALEREITSLKGENLKLSKFMQDLIQQLEEKKITFKEESEIKGKASHQNEIDKLKERVNILQIDNEELQKQLVRMRYGIYSPRGQDAKTPDAKHKKEPKEDVDESKNDNSTAILFEEIKELRTKLYSEVEKLKNWRESVQHLMKELENRPKDSNKNQRDESSDRVKPKSEETSRKKNKYEEILNDLNNNFNGAFEHMPQLNITDLIMRYVGIDKKQAKTMFESVSNYFKKAQEKTKVIFDENMKNDMWNFFGDLRKQWLSMKKIFSKHPKTGKPSGADKPHFEKSHQSETNYKKNYKHEVNPETRKEKPAPDVEDQFQNEPNAGTQDNLKYPSYKQKLEESAEETVSRNSWVFERATYRSQSRENEDEVNWYLRNRKDASESQQNEHINWFLKNRQKEVSDSDDLEQDELVDSYEDVEDFYAL